MRRLFTVLPALVVATGLVVLLDRARCPHCGSRADWIDGVCPDCWHEY